METAILEQPSKSPLLADQPADVGDFTERHFEILKTIHDDRYSTYSILNLQFPPDSRATPRFGENHVPRHPGTHMYSILQKFRDDQHRYVGWKRFNLGEEKILYLRQRGADFLREHGVDVVDTDWEEKNRTISEIPTKHTLMIARFKASLIAALRRHPDLSLYRFDRERSISWQYKGKKITLTPDAFITLRQRSTGKKVHFFFEADRSTMGHGKMIEKYTKYSLLLTSKACIQELQINSFRVLTSCITEERAINLHGLPSRKDVVFPPDTRIPRDYRILAGNLDLYHMGQESSYRGRPTNVLSSMWRKSNEPWIDDERKAEFDRAIIKDPLPFVHLKKD